MKRTIPNIRSTLIATLGPSLEQDDLIHTLIEAGVHCYRLNFSHGTHESHAEAIRRVRRVAERMDQPVGLLGDLSGPKIRIGTFREKQVNLVDGQGFFIGNHLEIEGTCAQVGSNYSLLHQDIKKGNRVLLDDGRIVLQAEAVKNNGIAFTVLQGGDLSDRKGINLPNIPLSIPGLTDKDKHDFQFMLEQQIDFAALSFVRTANDIKELRALAKNHSIQIIAKIEKPEAVANIDSIIDASDGIMVARGDLGVEMPLEKVPAIQKDIIHRCIAKEVPVITATQMLDSMAQRRRPTRAEASDVFNAVLDGSDAIMLSNETAVGNYPLLAVKTMAVIAREAEALLAQDYTPQKILQIKHSHQAPVTSANPLFERIQRKGRTMALVACQTAMELDARAIVTWTKGGNTARRIANYHPPLPIIALSPSQEVCQQLSLHYGVIPFFVKTLQQIEDIFQVSEQIIQKAGVATSGDLFVIVAGIPFTDQGHTNLMKMHVIP